MKLKIILSVFIFLICLSSITLAQKENRYHKFEITILDATNQETQNKYITQINRALESKHCSYNSSNSKFTFYTRKYFTINGIRDFLAANNVIADGNIKYTPPLKKIETKQNTSSN